MFSGQFSNMSRLTLNPLRIWRGFGGGRLVAIILMLSLVGLRAIDPPILEALRLRTFDFYQLYKPREKQPLPVRIVDIDEASLAYLGQWPWPRDTIADLLATITRLGGVAVAFDILFAEEDRLSPDAFARSLPRLSSDASKELLSLPNTDALFGERMKQMRIVLGQSGSNQPPARTEDAATQTTPIAFIGGDPKPYLVGFPGILRNIPVLEEAAAGRGLFSIRPDLDGIVRRVPLIMTINETVQPALSIDLLRVATGQSAFAVKTNNAGIQSVVVGGVEVPTDRNGRLWVSYTKHDPDRYVSARALFRGEVAREKIANHLIIVGTSAVGLLDLKPTPLDPAMPGVEIHAQLLETIMSKSYLVRPNYAIGAEIVGAIMVTLMIIILVPILGALPVLVFGFLIAAAMAGGSWYLYSEHRILIDIVYPLAVTFLVFLTLVFLNYRREEQQRRQIRSAFGQYLAPALVEQLAKEPDRLALGGETRPLTILFSDVRGFTAISESYKADPQGLTRLMNRFLTPLSNAIISRNGTIDKYMGDAVMAFWNAPLDDNAHALNACRAALDMIARVDPLNEERMAESEVDGTLFLPLKIGVGINTGEAVVGNMGSEMRFDYSVLGDSVNLASRLEGQSKTYGWPIILGSQTANAAAQEFAVIEIDLIQVKGKQEPERVFALLGDEMVLKNEDYQSFASLNAKIIAHYRAAEFDEAEAVISEAEGLVLPFPQGDYLALYRERISLFRKDPPPVDWDGVFVATSK